MTAVRPRTLPVLAALCGFLAVVAGAFGAHGVADPMAKDILRTGAEYGLVHALAVFAALSVGAGSGRASRIAAWLGAVPPFGGLAMMAGWLTLAYAAFGAA